MYSVHYNKKIINIKLYTLSIIIKYLKDKKNIKGNKITLE